MTAVPTVTEVREWLKLPATVPDEEIATVLSGELAAQFQVCRIADADDRSDDLISAVYRRCAREWAARGAPLGLVGVGEEFGASGTGLLTTFDGEIERLERPYRKFAFG